MACVGVFDSGIGGLNVLAACMQRLPGCRFYYYGDNVHAPYGARPKEEIVRFTRHAMRVFASMRVDAAVLACNTVTAVCVEEMRSEFSFPVVGMEPALRPAAASCRDVLVLATPHTIASERLRSLILRAPACRFTLAALPDLAGEIERCLTRGTPLTLSDHLPDVSPDGVVLGCTHYVFFRREIARFYGCPVFDGVQGTANRLAAVLSEVLEEQKIGTDDHHCPTWNPNNCLTKKYIKCQKNRVIFLGNSKNINKKTFFSNICFTSN